MAFEVIRHTFPAVAASAIPAPFALVGIASGADRKVVPLASTNARPLGVTGEAVASGPGNGVTVRDLNNYVKVPAVGSIGAGAEVTVATYTGSQYLYGPAAAASGVSAHSAGQSVTQAGAAGEFFTFAVNPRQLSNLA